MALPMKVVWSHDFPKIARDSGFAFNTRHQRIRIDWNRISAIDVDRVIRESDFMTIEEAIDSVIEYCLESEYDVKILDSNFVKLFRLAQLAVEYLLHCKHYLDQSVVILKDELKYKLEENVKLKKEIIASENLIKDLKDKIKERDKQRLYYDRKLNDSRGEIYKCPHCPKTFVSAVFVNGHVSRRHGIPNNIQVSSPVHEQYRSETEKLHEEIKSLKERLNETERVQIKSVAENAREKDHNDVIEEQHKKYHEEIASLKNALFDEIKNLRQKDPSPVKQAPNTTDENLKDLLFQQEKDISRVKDELQERLAPEIEKMQQKLDSQEKFWKTKLEWMESQHRSDMEKIFNQLRATQDAAVRIKTDCETKVFDLEKQSLEQSKHLSEQFQQLSVLTNASINHAASRRPEIKSFLEATGVDGKDKKISSTRNTAADLGKKPESSDSEEETESSSESEKVPSKKNTDSINPPSPLAGAKTSQFQKINDAKNTSTATKVIKVGSYQNKKDTQKLAPSPFAEGKVKTFLKDTSESTSSPEKPKKESNTQRVDVKDKRRNDKPISPSETESESEESEASEESSTSEEASTESAKSSETLETDKNKVRKKINRNFNAKLREIGIDPDWKGIPRATFKQQMDNIEHQRNINSKRFHKYNEIRKKITERLMSKLPQNQKETKNRSSLDKFVSGVKFRAIRAFKSEGKSNEAPRRRFIKDLLPKRTSEAETTLEPEERFSDDAKTEKRQVVRAIVVKSEPDNAGDVLSNASSIDTDMTLSGSRVHSTPIKSQAKRRMSLNEDSPRNRSALKGSNSSVSRLPAKKRVIFDLDKRRPSFSSHTSRSLGQLNAEREDKIEDLEDSISEIEDHKMKSASAENINLRTSQSEKIAQISRKIQDQLAVTRRKPAGSVETMVRDKADTGIIKTVAEDDRYSSTSVASSILESPVVHKSNEKRPQPLPRNINAKSVQKHDDDSFMI